MSKPIDLIGQKFGRLTVLQRAENTKYGSTQWLCQCECGNQKIIAGSSLRKGLTQSCGCLKKEKLQEYNQQHTQDETGKRYGKLTVLYRNTNPECQKDGRAIWVCQCDCGNIINVSGKSLREGHTKSCGCLIIENSSQIGKITGPINGGKNFKDLIGQRFGKLIVLERDKNTPQGLAQWKCKCDCGSILTVRGASLRNGNTTSCGCIKSKGEEKISNLLHNNNIIFSREYNIQILSHNYRFDFIVFNNNNIIQYLIEYDGIQHYEDIEYFNNNSHLQQTNDTLKNQWCKENNIPLIRIPYWHLNDLCLEDLLLETSKFII